MCAFLLTVEYSIVNICLKCFRVIPKGEKRWTYPQKDLMLLSHEAAEKDEVKKVGINQMAIEVFPVVRTSYVLLPLSHRILFRRNGISGRTKYDDTTDARPTRIFQLLCYEQRQVDIRCSFGEFLMTKYKSEFPRPLR